MTYNITILVKENKAIVLDSEMESWERTEVEEMNVPCADGLYSCCCTEDMELNDFVRHEVNKFEDLFDVLESIRSEEL